MKRLQELEIYGCERLTDVFESEWSANNVEDGSAHGGAGTTLTRPTLRNTTIVAAPQLSNLIRVCIDRCDLLPYIFTFNTLESLKQLKELRVINCKAIQVIVKEEITGKSSKEVVFPRLETLELDSLPSLKGFFLGRNDFRWPSLDDVVIHECPQLMMLTSGQSTTPKLKYIHTWFGKYSLERDLHGVVNQVHVFYYIIMHHLVNKHLVIEDHICYFNAPFFKAPFFSIGVFLTHRFFDVF
ncbi:putative leucine-rich repeat domain superfamily [Helianthus debilis subsp. tardiflorus]